MLSLWTKCLTIFKIQISLTLFIMGETLPPVYFPFHCKKTCNGWSLKFWKDEVQYFFKKANDFCIWVYCSYWLRIFLYHKLFTSLDQRAADDCFYFYCHFLSENNYSTSLSRLAKNFSFYKQFQIFLTKWFMVWMVQSNLFKRPPL